jgi:hypothetical protein
MGQTFVWRHDENHAQRDGLKGKNAEEALVAVGSIDPIVRKRKRKELVKQAQDADAVKVMRCTPQVSPHRV